MSLINIEWVISDLIIQLNSMEDKELIQIALDLSSSWFVKDGDLNTSKKRMDIFLDFTKVTKSHVLFATN